MEICAICPTTLCESANQISYQFRLAPYPPTFPQQPVILLTSIDWLQTLGCRGPAPLAIEEGILEKHQGYHYEHCYAYDWNAMRGYHYLMRIGHLLNVLAAFSVKLVKAFKEKRPRGFIEFVRTVA